METPLKNSTCYYGGHQFAKLYVFKEKKFDMTPQWDYPIEKFKNLANCHSP